jgi:hypothetical protein
VFLHFFGKLKFQITNQQITIQTKFSGLKIEDIPEQNMQQCAAKFAAPDFSNLKVHRVDINFCEKNSIQN